MGNIGKLSLFMAMSLLLTSLGNPALVEQSGQSGILVEQQADSIGNLQEDDAAEDTDEFPGDAATEDTDGFQGDVEIEGADESQEDSVAESEGTNVEGEADLDYVLGREMTEEEERQQRELFDLYASQSRYMEPEDLGGDISLSESDHIDQAWILAAWKGAVAESFCPYERMPEVSDTSPEAVYDNTFSRLTGWYRMQSSDRNAVKEAVMEYALSTYITRRGGI